MRQAPIGKAADDLDNAVQAAVQKALDKIRAAVQDSLDEAKTNRSDRTSE